MNLVEYEFSSDEEENEIGKENVRIFLTAEKENENEKEKEKEKETDKGKEKEKEKGTRWDDSHNKNNDNQRSKNENKHNKNTFDKYTYRKKNVDDVKIKPKQRIHNEQVLGKNDFTSRECKKRKVENKNDNNVNGSDILKEKSVTSNESPNNYKNSEPNKKMENNLKKSGRRSRWDNVHSTKVPEEKNLIENVKDIKNLIKVETAPEETKGFIVKRINKGEREQKQEEELQQEQEKEKKEKEKEKEKGRKVDDESAFFENTHLMNIDINENNFENIFEQMPNEYSTYIDKKIDELKRLYDMGLTINKRISESNEYKNPCILEKIMNIFDIEEYASNYPLHIFNPKDLDAVDLFNQHEKNTDETIKKSSKWSSRN